MRKGRIAFWLFSFVICAIVIIVYKKEENKIPYEERTELKVYCKEEFMEDVKKIIEKSSIGETNRVVFTDNKNDAEIILTDRITVSDNGYERIGWTPLIVAFDDTTKNKIKFYKEAGYLIKVESNNSYTIDFVKIITDTLTGKWTDKIYCPKLDTREGELFFDFLLININGGKYPLNEEEMEYCIEKANEFLNSSIVIQVNSVERLKSKKTLENELYIIFEKDIYDMNSSSYEFEIAYPTDTVIYEFYYYCQGDNAKEIKETINKKIKDLMYTNYIRYETITDARKANYYATSNGFSYVEIPMKEE